MEGQNYFSLACKFRDKPVDLTPVVCFGLGCHQKENTWFVVLIVRYPVSAGLII